MAITAEVRPVPHRIGSILQRLIEVGILNDHPGGAPFLTTFQEWICLPTIDGEGEEIGQQDFRITIECLGDRAITEYGDGPNVVTGKNYYNEQQAAAGG